MNLTKGELRKKLEIEFSKSHGIGASKETIRKIRLAAAKLAS